MLRYLDGLVQVGQKTDVATNFFGHFHRGSQTRKNCHAWVAPLSVCQWVSCLVRCQCHGFNFYGCILGDQAVLWNPECLDKITPSERTMSSCTFVLPAIMAFRAFSSQSPSTCAAAWKVAVAGIGKCGGNYALLYLNVM